MDRKSNRLEQLRNKARASIINNEEDLGSWQIGKNYQISNKFIGKGAYSTVALGVHIPSGTKVAIKKITKFIEEKGEAVRILRQVVLLRMLSHPNIIKLYEIIIPDTVTFKQIYLVEQYLPFDIVGVFRSNLLFTQDNIEKIIFSTLVALLYLHKAKVLHRDLKPQNILVDKDFTAKLCDFGLARTISNVQTQMPRNQTQTQMPRSSMEIEEELPKKHNSNLTNHVATRWYRAPELILLQTHYNSAIDIWSVGCIFGELLTMRKENVEHVFDRAPLFPGKACYPMSPPKKDGGIKYKKIKDFFHSTDDQLNVIFQVLGTPNPKDTDFLSDPRAIQYLSSFTSYPKQPWNSKFRNLTPQSEDFLEKTLVFNPKKRLTIDQAVNHPLFDRVREKFVVVEAEPLLLDLENLTLGEIKQRFIQEQEIYKTRPPRFGGSV